jgi:hypothetical protein
VIKSVSAIKLLRWWHPSYPHRDWNGTDPILQYWTAGLTTVKLNMINGLFSL